MTDHQARTDQPDDLDGHRTVDHPGDPVGDRTGDPAGDHPGDPVGNRAGGVPDDPSALSLEDLRALRVTLQREDDVVSYVRRVAQARLDLVTAELGRRDRGDVDVDLPSELRVVLSRHLTGGPARPPRPVDDLGDNPLSDELDTICAEHGFSRLHELAADEAIRLGEALAEFERRVSADRRDRFDRLDALSAELVRRYRDGEATVDNLLGEF